MKQDLTEKQKVLLLWLKIKLENNEITQSTFNRHCSLIRNEHYDKTALPSALEQEYLDLFASEMEINEFFAKCLEIKNKISGKLKNNI